MSNAAADSSQADSSDLARQVAEEQVLVIPTAVFHELGHFQGFTSNIKKYLPGILGCADISYRPRGEMEVDPSFKQLIPYVVFRCPGEHGEPTIFNYRRGGGSGEARLRAKRSVGVGGHISTVDAQAAPGSTSKATSTGDVYREGLERELAEEVLIDTPFREACVGLINDDETEVGKVHLGVVHVFDVDRPTITPREEDIADARFTPLNQIAAELDHYESWSQIAVRALVEIAG